MGAGGCGGSGLYPPELGTMQGLSTMRGRRSFGVGLGSVVLGLLAACSSSEDRGREASLQQAATAWANGTCTLEVLVPPQVDTQATPLAAITGLTIGDRAEARTKDGSLAPVINAGEGAV